VLRELLWLGPIEGGEAWPRQLCSAGDRPGDARPHIRFGWCSFKAGAKLHGTIARRVRIAAAHLDGGQPCHFPRSRNLLCRQKRALKLP
jgi:hypothetical protein